MSTIAEVLASQQQSYVGTYTAGNFDSMKEDIARWAEKNPDSPFAKAEPTFTRSKGGTAEREEIISQIQVPHLWHTLLGIREGTKVPKAYRDAVADAVYETWQLCHDMRTHLQANGEAQKATVEDLPGYCGGCIRDRLASDVDYGQVFESFKVVASDHCDSCTEDESFAE